MAKLILVAVKDRAVDAFMNPFVVPSRGMAIRAFGDEMNKSDSAMRAHPDDYDLYELGEFDQDTGVVVSDVKQLAIGKNVVVQS